MPVGKATCSNQLQIHEVEKPGGQVGLVLKTHCKNEGEKKRVAEVEMSSGASR